MYNISPQSQADTFLLITQDEIITKRTLKLYYVLKLGPMKVSYLFVLKGKIAYNSHLSTNTDLSQAFKFSAIGLCTCSTDKLFSW